MDLGELKLEVPLSLCPHDLAEQLVAGTHPAVEGDPVDADLGGQRPHVQPAPLQERTSGQPDRVSCGGSRWHGHRYLDWGECSVSLTWLADQEHELRKHSRAY